MNWRELRSNFPQISCEFQKIISNTLSEFPKTLTFFQLKIIHLKKLERKPVSGNFDGHAVFKTKCGVLYPLLTV